MNTLTKGANALLTKSGTVNINLSWKSRQINLEVVCFAVTTSGKVPTDEWFLFYNQPHSPANAITFSRQPGSTQAEFAVNLDKLPADVQKCVFAAALDEGSFRNVTDAAITATSRTGEALTFKMTDASNEQALIFAEVYRHSSGWKMRAIGQGFKGGLQPLAEHYGVVVADEQPAKPSPSPSPVSETRAHPPLPPVPPIPPVPPAPSRRRSKFLRKVAIFSGLAMFVLVISILVLNYYYPQLLFLLSPQLASVIRSPADHSSGEPQPAKPYVAPICSLADDQVFERYHTLGDNYVKILQIVDASNENLAKLKDSLKAFDTGCPQGFSEKNKQEIDKLEKLPIQGWIEETVRLNVCAGIMIKKVDTDVKSELRPTVIQRLLKNADRSRNLESDLTNISRDLAYLNNKAIRLVEGYKSNLEACLK